MAPDSDRDPNRFREGPEAADRFEDTLKRLVNVPRDELAKREATYQKSRAAKKRRAVRPSAR